LENTGVSEMFVGLPFLNRKLPTDKEGPFFNAFHPPAEINFSST
jgi:hypothetical protein